MSFSHCSQLCLGLDFLRLALTDLEPAKEARQARQGVPGFLYPSPQCWGYKSTHPTLLYVHSEGWTQVLRRFTSLTCVSLLSLEGIPGQLFQVEFQCGLKGKNCSLELKRQKWNTFHSNPKNLTMPRSIHGGSGGQSRPKATKQVAEQTRVRPHLPQC